MTAPIFTAFHRGPCNNPNLSEEQLKVRNKAACHTFAILSAFDTIASISSLVIGILTITSVIALPSVVSYSLLATSGVITVAWIALLTFPKN